MDFEVYGDDSGAILKLDPRVKILIFFAANVVVLNSYGRGPDIVYGAFLCAILALCGKKLDGLKFFCLWAFLLFFRLCVQTSGTGHPFFTSLFTVIIGLIQFSFPVLLSLTLLIRTTRINHLLSALQAMHMPAFVIIPFAVLIRFIPTVQDEWNGIQKAMAFRNISLEPGAIARAPMETIEYILIPLLFSCVAVIEEMTATALARGLDSEKKRTSYETVRMTAADYVVSAITAALVVVAFVYGNGRVA